VNGDKRAINELQDRQAQTPDSTDDDIQILYDGPRITVLKKRTTESEDETTECEDEATRSEEEETTDCEDETPERGQATSSSYSARVAEASKKPAETGNASMLLPGTVQNRGLGRILLPSDIPKEKHYEAEGQVGSSNLPMSFGDVDYQEHGMQNHYADYEEPIDFEGQKEQLERPYSPELWPIIISVSGARPEESE